MECRSIIFLPDSTRFPIFKPIRQKMHFVFFRHIQIDVNLSFPILRHSSSLSPLLQPIFVDFFLQNFTHYSIRGISVICGQNSFCV